MDFVDKRFLLVDGHAMLYRAFFAYPQSLTTRQGELINAVYGFTSILLNTIQTLNPSHLLVSFDVGKTWRHEEYPLYKAHREKMPDELREQEGRIYEVLEALNVPIYTLEGYEADDVLGTLAWQISEREADMETLIVTHDMDALQLVRDASDMAGSVGVYAPSRGTRPSVWYTETEVLDAYGLTPRQIIDLKGLAGDSSDNIPGVKGIGAKTATKLLKLMPSVEEIYEEIDAGIPNHGAVLRGAVLKRLVNDREEAFESKHLVTISTDVPVSVDLTVSQLQHYDKERTLAVFEELSFTSLVSKLPQDDFETDVQEALF